MERDEIVRGYEIENGRFVVVTDEELDALEPKKSREIDLRRFVPEEQIDPLYFGRSYFFVPSGDSQKPYRLLAIAMEKTKRAGIATFVMRSKEYLVAILAERGLLRAETLRFSDEIRTPRDLGLPEPSEVPESRVKEMEREIRAATARKIDPEEMKDREADRLLELVRGKKARGEGLAYASRQETEEEKEEEGGKVIDIMEALKRSVEQSGQNEGEVEKKRVAAERSGENRLRKVREKSKKELYEQAKKLDIPGRSGMDKDELAEAIRSADQ